MAKKPRYVYHGSPKLIEGMFELRAPRDLNKDPDNIVEGVYASSVKDKAIGMAVSGATGVISSGMGFGIGNKRKGIIYEGWPNQEYVYLYTFDPKPFIRRPADSTQFIATKKVSPLKVEKLRTVDHIHLVKKASKRELNNFHKKHGRQIE